VWVYIVLTSMVVCPALIGLKTMHEVSFIAIFGMMATVFTVVVIVIFSFIDGNSYGDNDHQMVNFEDIPTAFAALVFAFGCHNVIPSIQDSMAEPASFKLMLNSAFTIVLIMYLPPCFFGYYFFWGQDFR